MCELIECTTGEMYQWSVARATRSANTEAGNSHRTVWILFHNKTKKKMRQDIVVGRGVSFERRKEGGRVELTLR